MKKLTIILLTVLAVFGGQFKASAQGKYGADSAQCLLYLSYYQEYWKQKNYDSALPNWRKAYKYCVPGTPGYKQTMLIDGQQLMRRLIAKNAANKEYKAALIDTLMTLHDLRINNFPKYQLTAVNNKGIDIANFYKGDNQKVFDGLEVVVSTLNENVKPSILINDLDAAIALYQDGKLDPEKVISTYQRNLAIIKSVQPAQGQSQEDIDKVKADIEGLFINSKVASCENLIALFTPRFDADPDNVELATTIVKMMSNTEDCVNNELFLRATTSMHKNEPSAQSAYFLYRLNSVRGNAADAIKYLEEAIASPDSDTITDANYNYELAAFCYKNGQNVKAADAARKAVELDESLAGKSYMLLGTIWGSIRCGGNEIENRAPYWVAVDYLQRARTADPSLADEANRLIGQYSRYFPATADAFMYDVQDGQSYTVSCGGLRATTTVRTQK